MKNHIIIPDYLIKVCQEDQGRAVWLEQLPETIKDLCAKWSLTLGEPITIGASCSWVAPCLCGDGRSAVFKLGMPHREAEGEIDGLLFWDGDPTVFLLRADRARNALLLELCLPGTPLHQEPEHEQDRIIAKVLRRMWSKPLHTPLFRPLTEMIAAWNEESLANRAHYPDVALLREGIAMRTELAANATEQAVLATDLHAGNILRAERKPWLAIDPKPFYGDPAYDATQHLLNCQGRLATAPRQTIVGFAELLEVDYKRVQLWLFARLAAEFRGRYQALARKIVDF